MGYYTSSSTFIIKRLFAKCMVVPLYNSIGYLYKNADPHRSVLAYTTAGRIDDPIHALARHYLDKDVRAIFNHITYSFPITREYYTNLLVEVWNSKSRYLDQRYNLRDVSYILDIVEDMVNCGSMDNNTIAELTNINSSFWKSVEQTQPELYNRLSRFIKVDGEVVKNYYDIKASMDYK